MNPRQFLHLAAEMAEGPGPAYWRSAISRAYYAVFNTTEEFLARMGFLSPKKDYHIILQRRLLASKDKELESMGSDLGDFHVKRIRADYKMQDKGSENQNNARAAVREAERMISILDSCPIHGERWKKIKQAIQKME
ncbi:MAG TPA: hypothetical protein VKE98_24765 [Gemmataceae bacterium]|nr:hypothetical protein [Gemmataceae bacterium]